MRFFAGGGPGASAPVPDGSRGAAPRRECGGSARLQTAAAGLTFSEKRVYSPSSLRALCCIERRFRQILSEDALPNLVPAEGLSSSLWSAHLQGSAAVPFVREAFVRTIRASSTQRAAAGSALGCAAPPPADPLGSSAARGPGAPHPQARPAQRSSHQTPDRPSQGRGTRRARAPRRGFNSWFPSSIERFV